MESIISLENLLELLDEGILVVDKYANVIIFNSKALSMEGIEKESIRGKNILDIFPNLTAETSLFYRVLNEEKSIIDYYQNFTNINGYKGSLLTSVIPLYEKDDLVGAVEIYKDITKLENISYEIYSLQKKLAKNMDIDNLFKDSNAIYKIEHLVGNSTKITALKEKIRKISDSDSSVMVFGETGVGKELVVQAIHNSSKRKNSPFIAQNCAALPKNLLESILFGTTEGSFTGAKNKLGLFELANNGTLFLDEINSMDIELQAKLLRVLQQETVRRLGDTKTYKVNTRIITSMNEDPMNTLKHNKLRKDLYYRLNVIELCIPTLKERKEDIKLLVNYFINIYNKKLNKKVKSISNEINDIFTEYKWPGNVRELKYTIENIMNFIENNEITKKDLPKRFLPQKSKHEILSNEEKSNTIVSLKDRVKDYEIKLIKSALSKADGNMTKAAKILKIPKQTLHNKLLKYKIN